MAELLTSRYADDSTNEQFQTWFGIRIEDVNFDYTYLLGVVKDTSEPEPNWGRKARANFSLETAIDQMQVSSKIITQAQADWLIAHQGNAGVYCTIESYSFQYPQNRFTYQFKAYACFVNKNYFLHFKLATEGL